MYNVDLGQLQAGSLTSSFCYTNHVLLGNTTVDKKMFKISIETLPADLFHCENDICDILLPSLCLQISEEGRGVASIANMLTITRIHNSVSAAAAMRRHDCTRVVQLHCNLYSFVKHAVHKVSV